jgi:hypothetical protein
MRTCMHINLQRTLFVHFVVCLTTGPKPFPQRVLHTVRSKAFSFKWEYSTPSLRSSSSYLRLLPLLPFTSIHPFIFPSITCCRRQFLRKIWPIQLSFRLLIWWRMFLCSLTLSNTSSLLTWSVQLIFSILLQHNILNFPGVSDLLPDASNLQHHTQLCSKCSILQVNEPYIYSFGGLKVLTSLINQQYFVDDIWMQNTLKMIRGKSKHVGVMVNSM